MAEIHCRRCTMPIVPGDSDEASVCPLDDCKVQFQGLFPAVGAELLPPEPKRVAKKPPVEDETIKVHLSNRVSLNAVSLIADQLGLNLYWDKHFTELFLDPKE